MKSIFMHLDRSNHTSNRKIVYAAVCLLLMGQWLLAWTASLDKSVTFDEIAHVTAGISYWQKNDYRLQPENGNFPQRWVALPSWLKGTRLPPDDSPAWAKSNVWNIGYQTFYETTGQDHRPRLIAARGMNALLMTGVGLLVFILASNRWGDTVGLLTLLVFALDPNFLAHGALATSDMAATLLLPASLCIYWWHIQSPRWCSQPLSAGALGLACVSKFAAILLLPAIIILLLFRVAIEAPPARLRITRQLLIDGLAQVAAILAIIWAFYGFRYSGMAPSGPAAEGYYATWKEVLGDESSLRFTLLDGLRRFHLLPESFIYGGGFVAARSEMRLTFFRGELGIHGWLWFFPYLFLVKTPLTTLALMLSGAVAVLRGWHKSGLRSAATARSLRLAAPLLVWTGIYAAASLATNLNIGHRHLLPLYPGLFVLCGAAIYALRKQRMVIAGLLGLLAYESFGIRPHYIAYFNPLDSGPSKAWTKVVDSSLDWGQDLPGTAIWLAKNARKNEPVYLSYFGMGEPVYYGIKATTLQRVPAISPYSQWHRLNGGLYVISSTLMQLNVAEPWTEDELRNYHGVRTKLETNLKQPVSAHQLAALSSINRSRLLLLYNNLRPREPVAVIGHSIRIYRLSEAEARAIDFGLVPAREQTHEPIEP
jgi:hypothetical protein